MRNNRTWLCKGGRARGAALILALVALVNISAGVLLLTSLAYSENQATEGQRLFSIADAMAEAAVQYAARQAGNAVVNYQTPMSSGTVQIGGTQVSYVVTHLPPDQTEVCDPATNVWQPYTGTQSGYQRFVYPYQIDATASYQENAGGAVSSSTIHAVVEIRAEPIFQFLSFYGNASPLEILTGPNATFTGRIHSNLDLYIGNGSYGATTSQTYDTDYLHTAGQVHHARMDNSQQQAPSTNNATGGTLTIKIFNADGSVSNNYVPMESKASFDSQNIPSITGFDSQFAGYSPGSGGPALPAFVPRATQLYGGTLQTAAMGVTPLSTPPLNSLNPYVPAANGNYQLNPTTGQYVAVTAGTGNYNQGYYLAQANFVVKYSQAQGQSVVLDGTGHDITSTLPPGTVTDVPASAKALYDARQGAYIATTQIDLSKLDTVPSFVASPNGVLLYMYRDDTTTAQPNGFSLVNGQILSNRLTVASPDPVYVIGDYNTGRATKFTDLNNDLIDDNTHIPLANWTVEGQKQGAAVLADAVNLLSNAWNGSKGPGTLPTAVTTVYNFAMLSGTVPTVPNGTYSGGLENFPRFQEDWSGQTACYTGSFVNLWPSQYATAPWGNANVYLPPNRDWNFDTDYLNASKMPPQTPLVVNTVQVVWWR